MKLGTTVYHRARGERGTIVQHGYGVARGFVKVRLADGRSEWWGDVSRRWCLAKAEKLRRQREARFSRAVYQMNKELIDAVGSI